MEIIIEAEQQIGMRPAVKGLGDKDAGIIGARFDSRALQEIE